MSLAAGGTNWHSPVVVSSTESGIEHSLLIPVPAPFSGSCIGESILAILPLLWEGVNNTPYIVVIIILSTEYRYHSTIIDAKISSGK